MFNNVKLTHDERKDIYTFKGFFGNSFVRIMRKKVISNQRIASLFIDFGPNEISFYGFFAIEVRVIFEKLQTFPSGLNQPLISNVLTKLSDETWLADMNTETTSHFDYSIIDDRMNFKILDHQKVWFKDYENLKHRMHYRGRLLAAAPGSGKTAMSLMLSELVNSKVTLIIAPLPSIQSVWIKSLEEDVYKSKQDYFLVDGKRKYGGEKFIICHYEAIRKIAKFIHIIVGKDTTIVIDESHNLNELKSNRTKDLLSICNAIGSDNILLLSGTPIKAAALEMVPMLEMLDARFTKRIRSRFINLHKSSPHVLKPAITERYVTHRTKIEKESLELQPVTTVELKVKLKNGKVYTLENIRKDAQVYATKRYTEIMDEFDTYVEKYNSLLNRAFIVAERDGIGKSVLNKYIEDVKIIKAEYESGSLMNIPNVIKEANEFEASVVLPRLNSDERKEFKEASTIVKYVGLKIRGEVLGKVIGRARIDCHADIASQLKYKDIINSTTKKTIIFSNYVDVCTRAEETVKEIGYNPIGVYGDTTKDLNSNVNKFMVAKNDINPLIATYKSLSTAVPLIAANVMICIDLPFREYILKQAIARIHRLGQDKKVYVYQVYLDTGGEANINSRNIDIISWSSEMVSDITGDEIDVDVIKNEGTVTKIMDDNHLDTFKKMIGLEEKNIVDTW